MKVLDRIAGWLGYVPAERLVDVTATFDRATREKWLEWNCECCSHTETIVKPRSQIIVAADYQRGIPCS